MRALIVFLLLIGGAAAVFYETNADRSAPHWTEQAPMVSQGRGADAVDTAADEINNASNEKGESAKLGFNDSLASDPTADDNAPPLPQQAEDLQQRKKPSDKGSASAAKQTEQSQPFRQSLAIALLLKRNKARKSSDALAAARQDLVSAVKERGELAARVSELGSESSKLQATLRARGDEVADARRRLAEQVQETEKNAAAAGAGRSALQREMTASKDKAEDAVAKQREAEGRLARSEALADEQQRKLADLDATKQAETHAREELKEKDATASRQAAGLAETSKKFVLFEAKVRDLTSDRNAATMRIAQMTAQRHLAATGLWAARLVLAEVRAAAQQRVAALELDHARQLADANEALRKQSQEARAQIETIRGALSRATGDTDAAQARLQSLGTQRDSAETELAGTRKENAKLAARLDAAALESEKKVADLGARNAVLAGQAQRLPQLAHDLDANRKQLATLEKLVAGLKSQSEGQAARIDAMNRTANDSLAEKDAVTAQQVASATEAASKLALAEAKLRDLTADRDAVTARIARITAQQSFAATALGTAKLALAHAHAAAQQPSDEGLRRRSEESRRQTDEMRQALSRASEAAAAMQAQLRGLASRQQSADSDLAGARAENTKLAAQLVAVVSDSGKKLADLRQRNASLAGEAARLPELTHELDEGRKQTSRLESRLAALRSENEGQLARMDSLQRTNKSNEATLAVAGADQRIKPAASDEHARKVESALASTRAELARANEDKESSNRARQASEKALGASNAKHDAERSQVASSAAKSVSKPSPSPLNGPASLDRRASHPTLPDTFAAHILLRYAHDAARSQARAKTLRTALRTLGVDVNDSAAAGIGKPGNSVTYFYVEDQGIADQVAQQIAAPAPTRSRSTGVQPPRPGTIEVTVGG